MFRAEPMLRIRLLLVASEAADAALELARCGVYSPAQCAPAALDEKPADAYREAWLEADARVAKLAERCGALGPLRIPPGIEAPTLDDLRELNAWLRTVWDACLAAHEGEHRIEEELRHLDALQETLDKLHRLDVDLAQLLRPNSLLAVNIGSLPAVSVRRVSEALSLTNSLLYAFDTVGDLVYAVIAGPRERHAEVRGLLSQAGWRELPVPQELCAHPEAAGSCLIAERKRIEAMSVAECRRVDALRGTYAAGLEEARLRVALGRPLAEAAVEGVRGRGGLASLNGWIPARRVDRLRAALEARFHGQFWLHLEAPRPDEARQVPSLLRYPPWLRAFVPLVRNYGVPRYGEFDPTLLFALSYLLLFGAMFGDIGHGAVIAVLALALRRRLGPATWLGVAAGASSICFGFAYGSVFGFEDLVRPLWLSPLHDPMRVLAVAIFFGVGFIALTLLINIHNRLQAGAIAAALFDGGGLAGLAFHAGAVATLLAIAETGDSGLAAPVAAVVGLGTLAAHKWHETRAGLGERLLVTAMETLETGINLFANTLSFMRVAAFSLNHVALALAVFAIANGLGQTGHWLAIVLGNVFIIVLEGGIVAIQALRLMYFEGFSRFFSGDGKAFAPLRLAGAE